MLRSKIGYVAYIDEAGDAGLKTVRPLDPSGASEWLILRRRGRQSRKQLETGALDKTNQIGD